MTDKLHTVTLTTGELIAIREAVREFRTFAPEHVLEDNAKYARWLDAKNEYSPERERLDKLTTQLLTGE